MLDIIMAHYNEPWETGKKFFDMLDLQRGVNFDDIRVIIINDGHEYKLDDSHFEGRPYRVEQHSIDHAGVSAARNEGLKRASDTWITFCDFDDTFACVYSLKAVMDALYQPDADFYDVLWAEFISEKRGENGGIDLDKRPFNAVFNHAKYYRRQAILDHNIWFNTDLIFNEDSEFNGILYLALGKNRFGHIKNDIPIYVWVNQSESVTHRKDAYWHGRIGNYWRNKNILEAYKKYETAERYSQMFIRCCMDAYHTLNINRRPDFYEPLREDFLKNFVPYYNRHIGACDDELIQNMWNVSFGDYAVEKTPDFEVNKDIGFFDWIKLMQEEAGAVG